MSGYRNMELKMLMLEEFTRCNEACSISAAKERDRIPLSAGDPISSDAFGRKGGALL